MDAVDRARTFDNTLFVSQAGGAAREWDFETPPVTTALADTYAAVLGSPAAKLCSGDILQLPTMCSPELPGGTPVRKSVGHNVVLKFRLHEVQPAKVLLRYAPGDTIAGETFTRASTARYNSSAGVVTSAAIDVKRDSHYLNGVRTFLREGASTNLALQSENFGVTWGLLGTPTRSAAAHTASGITLDLIGDDDGAAAEGYIQTGLTFTGDGTKGISVYVKAGTSTAFTVRQRDSTAAANRLLIGMGWSAGLPILVAATTGTYFGYETLADGVFRLLFQAAGVVAANANEIRLYPAAPAALTAANTGDTYFGGVQIGNNPFPTSYIPTTTATVTRSADAHSLPFTAPPGETTAYSKIIEGGSSLTDNARLFQITDSANGSPKFAGYAPPGGEYASFHTTSSATVTSVLTTAPALLDVVEVVNRLFGDGSVDSVQSINGAAETSSTQSASNPLASAWAGQLVWLNAASATVAIGFNAFVSFKIVAGVRSLAEVRSL